MCATNISLYHETEYLVSLQWFCSVLITCTSYSLCVIITTIISCSICVMWLRYGLTNHNNIESVFCYCLRWNVAFACHTPLLWRSIDISCPPGPQQQTRTGGFAAVDVLRADTVPFRRPCCAYYAAGSGNNNSVTECTKLHSVALHVKVLQYFALYVPFVWHTGSNLCTIALLLTRSSFGVLYF